jgi:hypothetical protein
MVNVENIEIDEDIAKNTKPILILPLYSPDIDTSKLKFTSNKHFITEYFYDTNDIFQLYSHTGKYEMTASSTSPPTDKINFEPYNAFNKSDSGWKSAENDGLRRTSIYSVKQNTKDTLTVYQTKYAKLHNGPSYYNGNENTTISQPKINYYDNVNTDININGEWLQVHLPQNAPIYLFKYSIKVPPPSPSLYPEDRREDYKYNIPFPIPNPQKYTSHFPKVFSVVGSMDGNTWHYIDQQSFIDPPDLPIDSIDPERQRLNFKQGMTIDTGNNTVTFHVNSLDHYTYFRLIVTEMFPGNTCVQISQWGLFAFVDIITPNAMSVLTTENYENYSLDKIRKVDSKMNWDTFSENENSELAKLYKDQLATISQAKINKNTLSNIEGFDTNDQINTVSNAYSNYLNKTNQINQNYFDLGKKADDHMYNVIGTLLEPSDKYDYSSNSFNRKPTKVDGWITDNKEQVLQQNNMLILSTIAVTTVAIALIIIS